MLGFGVTAPTSRCATRISGLSCSAAITAPRMCWWRFLAGIHRDLLKFEVHQLRNRLPEFENDDSMALAISVEPPPTRSGRPGADACFRCCRTSGRMVRSTSIALCSSDTTGYSNRGTFFVDRSGIILVRRDEATR